MIHSRPIGRAIAGCLVFAGAWAAGHAAVAVARDGEDTPYASESPPPPSGEALRAAKEKALAGVRLRGELDPRLRALVAREAGDPSLVLVLRARDLRSCEDLGYQLRQLRRGAYEPLPVMVLTDSVSEPVVRAYLRREKLRVALQSLSTVDQVLLAPTPLPSPAALRVHEGWAEGVAFPDRIPGVRIRSFAQALASVAAPSRSGAIPPGPIPTPEGGVP